ncbi:MAG: hypothetical protein ACJA16_002973, partial [Akkermansiaceae bacterium]
MTAVHGRQELTSIDHFGRVDESPDEVFEALTPRGGEFFGGRVTSAGGDDFLTADFIGEGIEVVIPGDVAGWTEFFGGRWRGDGSTADLVIWRDLSEIEFLF